MSTYKSVSICKSIRRSQGLCLICSYYITLLLLSAYLLITVCYGTVADSPIYSFFHMLNSLCISMYLLYILCFLHVD